MFDSTGDRRSFLDGGGEMGRRMRAHDWAATPFGDPGTWPPTLRMIVALVLDSPLLGTILWGPELRMIYNDSYAPALGERHPAALGRPIADVWDMVWDQIGANFRRVYETGESLAESRLEVPMTRYGRLELTWWNYSVSAIRDEDGRVVGLLNQAIEITGQVHAEARQRDAEGRLRELNASLQKEVSRRTAERDRLWETTNDLMGTAGFDGYLKLVNPAWTALLGWSEAELLGRPFIEIVASEDHAATAEVVKRLMKRETVTDFVDHVLTEAGAARTIMWTAVPDPEADIFYIIGRDLTELHVAEEALRQSQKMEAVGQLTGGVAHDFNNLLTIIRSSVDLLRRPGLSEERRGRYMDAVSDTVDRAAKLTGQLLAFARRQALKPEVFEVGERLRAVAEMLDTVTGARIRVVTEIAERPCFVEADLSQFETALVNMAVNARDAMNGEGTLTLRLEGNRPLPSIRGHAGAAGPFAIVSLADTGSGIGPDAVGRIFEPFFTTKEVGKGTGLGLSQVFGFTKQSGGDIDVESRAGEGTVFHLYLPEVATQAAAEPFAAAADRKVGGNGRRVLVVEDNLDVGRFTSQLLQDLGYVAVWAVNAEEALGLLQGGERFDVVFSDVVMPGMGGIELAKGIRRTWPQLPVVLASGYSHILAQEGAHGFDLLHKPYSADQLSTVLHHVIRA